MGTYSIEVDSLSQENEEDNRCEGARKTECGPFLRLRCAESLSQRLLRSFAADVRREKFLDTLSWRLWGRCCTRDFHRSGSTHLNLL